LNDNTWERPRSTYKIKQCIEGSPSIYHGAPPRHDICFELFGTTKESELNAEQSQTLLQELESRSTWYIKRHNVISGIFSSKCEQSVDAQPGVDHAVCKKCLGLKGKNSLKKALNVKYATDNTIKFIPNNLMSRDLFQSKLMLHKELRQLNTSLEKQSKRGDSDFWTALAIRAKQGLFQQMGAFEGLVKAVAVRTEREAASKALNGIRFD
jgi:hypothetical protein